MTVSTKQEILRSSYWAVSGLASGGNLRIGIPDTILFNNGAPQAWLFTSKAGVVLKKRCLRKSSICDRFMRLFASNLHNPHGRVATVRFGDGTVCCLGPTSFDEMMTKFPATDPGVLSVQCYIQGRGNTGTVYRNSYRAANDRRPATTSTSSFTTFKADTSDNSVCTWNGNELYLERSRASGVNAVLDAVTRTVVRHLEAEANTTRILSVTCDYILDAAGQIWLTWIGESTVASVDAFRRHRCRRSALTSRHPEDFDHKFAGATSAVDRAAEVVELPRGELGCGAGGIKDTLSRSRSAEGLTSRPIQKTKATSAASVAQTEQAAPKHLHSTMVVGVRASEAATLEARGRAPGGKDYPSSFSCAGDYCAIRVLVSLSEGRCCSNRLGPRSLFKQHGRRPVVNVLSLTTSAAQLHCGFVD